MKKLAILLGVALFLLSGAPVYANGIPALPHAFYGTVAINGSPAPAGTTVEARGEGVATGIAGNPITTTDSGIYGSSSPFEPKLVVQGDIEEGTTITFYVNGVSTGQTAAWHSGETTQKNLSVTIAAPPPGPPGEGAIKTNFFGTKGSIRIDSEGIVLETFTVTSPDGRLTIPIPRGTKALDKDGNPLTSLTAAVDESPPDPPEGDNIIGLSYNFGPAGATFTPPITFTWSYDPADLPEGVAEEDLTIAYYDEEAGEWVELDCEVDTVNNVITASVPHFTTFAIIGAAKPAAFTLSSLVVSPTEVAPGEKVNISLSVANTGGTEGSYIVVLKINGVKEAEKSVTVAAGKSQTVSFSVAKEKAGSYSVAVDGLSGSFTVVAPPAPAPTPPAPTPPAPTPPAPIPPPPTPPAPAVPPPPAPPVNWPMISGIIAAVVVVVGLLIYFLVRRRAH